VRNVACILPKLEKAAILAVFPAAMAYAFSRMR
jgi:hypothetical protein